nr:NKR-P1E [Mus musculus]AFI61953.1 Nkrp1e variant [Mus musculus]AFK08675.1 Nkrp1 variant [Mus musculus]
MDTERIYLSLKPPRTPGAQRVSPRSLPPDACRCPRSHRLALKLSCAGLILLVLTLIGMSVLVGVLIQKTSIEKCPVYFQENLNKTRDCPAELECPQDWLSHRDKCFCVSQVSNTWKEGQADCDRKGATLLLIQDQEELITGDDIKNSCATISMDKVVSESCDSDGRWICQKELKLETIFHDS